MGWSVDLGNLPRAADRFERAYDRAADQMQKTLARAARTERRTHAYHNRTGNLQASTTASERMTVGDTDAVTLSADTPYAVYVNRRGLMRIDELAAEAEQELAYLFDSLSLVI
jgi:hypothetical protein